MNYFRLIIILFLSCASLAVHAHEGEDHAAAKKTASAGAATYFSSEAVSEKYELFVKYGTVKPGAQEALRLFITEFNSNKPVDSAVLQVSVPGNPAIKLSTARIDKGIYEIRGVFPQKQVYSLNVTISAAQGADLLQIKNIETGKALPVAETEAAHSHWYENNWLFGAVGLLAGLAIMFFVMKKRNRKVAASILVVLCLLPTAQNFDAIAHEGHNEPGKTSGALSNAFLVEKETQFLFNILTSRLGTGDFNETSTLLGTVIPAPTGQAVIQSPQIGKIVALRVTPGQKVSKGQTLAVIEQQVDAGTQIDIISQRNTIEAEYQAAKAQYERLKSIEDIAAKKDLTEAKARYDAARRNKQLFESNAAGNAGSTKLVTLTSPISGAVGTFNYAIGAVVNAGQTLFEITNLDNVYIEAQLFTTNANNLSGATKFTVSPAADSTEFLLKMLSGAQSVNQQNQSQRVVFQVMNPAGKFKIGENVNVRVYSNKVSRQVIIPDEAITDVNGKPAVFIKDNAETYSISFISAGKSNGKYTVINKGAEEGERIVTANVYQMKTMYLNQ